MSKRITNCTYDDENWNIKQSGNGKCALHRWKEKHDYGLVRSLLDFENVDIRFQNSKDKGLRVGFNSWN